MFKEIKTEMITQILPKITIVAFKIILIIIILLFWNRLVKFVLKILNSLIHSKKQTEELVDPLLETFMGSLIKAGMYILLFMIIVSLVGVQAASVATVLGTIGIAIGLGLQGSLSNLAGGVIILFFKQFSKGDYIQLVNGSEGTVSSIQILYTTLVTYTNQVVTIPNGQLANNSIINYSRNKERLLELYFPTSTEASTEKVLKILNDISDKHPDILQDKPKVIRLFKYNQYFLEYRFRVWTTTDKFWNLMYDCNEMVKIEFDKNNIELYHNKINIFENKNREA